MDRLNELMTSALAELRKQEQDMSTELASVREAISAVESILGTRTYRTVVRSQTMPTTWYTVTRLGAAYSCTCPSYRYVTGLNDDGHCKHIVEAKQRNDWRISK